LRRVVLAKVMDEAAATTKIYPRRETFDSRYKQESVAALYQEFDSTVPAHIYPIEP
jgi:hypothetical protein